MKTTVVISFGRSFVGVLSDVKTFLAQNGQEVLKIVCLLAEFDEFPDMEGVEFVRQLPRIEGHLTVVVNGGTTAQQWELTSLFWSRVLQKEMEITESQQRGQFPRYVAGAVALNAQRDGVSVLSEMEPLIDD